ncbi:unannotated protein [freshwater metagenome]|uniref:Unannotated protein n=1 Tax=freshwater metagenome TaxID=449393 RepID=A0A6J7EF36_9ZZZZ|nr:mycofactocin system glycosyltransferase [Actinomycetota bacterium]
MGRVTSYSIDRSVRRAGDGTVLIGGSPLTLFRLTRAGADLIDRIERGDSIESTPAVEGLLDRLLNAGALHPVPLPLKPGASGPTPRLTVVIPAYNTSPEDLDRLVHQCHAYGQGEVGHVIVVDDASAPAIGPIANATVIRIAVNGGPGVARSTGLSHVTTPLVAFVDTDVELTPGWLAPLLAHLDDNLVAVVAPRVGSRAGTTLLERYEMLQSPLDLGGAPARVRAGTRVSYLPAAALVCRADALRSVGAFDTALRLGEDVDLVWRLDKAGWRVRYEPAAEVTHRPRGTWVGWARQRHDYGTSAAPLAERHPGALAPVRVSGWSAAAWLAVAAGVPLVGTSIAAVTTALLARKLRSVPDGPRLALRLAGLGHLYAGRSLASGVSRAWWPLAALLSLVSRRARRVVLIALTLPAAIDWVNTRPGLDPMRYVGLRALDDLSYGTGLVRGCISTRSAEALLPDFRSWPGRSTRVAQTPEDTRAG